MRAIDSLVRTFLILRNARSVDGGDGLQAGLWAGGMLLGHRLAMRLGCESRSASTPVTPPEEMGNLASTCTYVLLDRASGGGTLW